MQINEAPHYGLGSVLHASRSEQARWHRFAL
jgi:hypothetical protein